MWFLPSVTLESAGVKERGALMPVVRSVVRSVNGCQVDKEERHSGEKVTDRVKARKG